MKPEDSRLSRLLHAVIVDDDPAFALALSSYLQREADVKVVGRVQSGREAIKMAAELHPDLLLVDFAMPDMTGAAVARATKGLRPRPAIIVMSQYDAPEYRDIAARSGVDGFVYKSNLEELLALLEGIEV